MPALLALEPMRALAKVEIRRWPVIGLLAARGGTLFVERERLRCLPAIVAEVAAVLRSRQSVLVFPEATTRCGRVHGHFYPAMFQAALDAGAPVRAVTVRYRLADGTPTTVAPFVGRESMLASVRRIVATRGLVIEVEAAPAMQPGTVAPDPRWAARRALAAETEARWRDVAKLPPRTLVGHTIPG